MKAHHRFVGDLRLDRPLALRPRGASFLASTRGSGRRSRWVFRWIGGGNERGSALLRPDFCALCSLSHPSLSLPALLGTDPPSGRHYILRPYVAGSEMLLATRGRSIKDLLPWLVAATDALGIIHRFGFLHRNIKAGNILVTRKALLSSPGSETKVILCDPAWWPEESGSPGHDVQVEAQGTSAGASEGKAPHGDEEPSVASDLRALGAVLYSVLTGKEMRVDAYGFPPRPSQANPEISLDLERLLLRLLHPDPERRYRDSSVLVEDLRLLCGSKAPPRLAPPDCFLDREEELARALEALGKTAEPRDVMASVKPAALAVTGEAGMGKTAFLHRLAFGWAFCHRRLGSLGSACRQYRTSGEPSRVFKHLTSGKFGGHLLTLLKMKKDSFPLKLLWSLFMFVLYISRLLKNIRKRWIVGSSWYKP